MLGSGEGNNPSFFLDSPFIFGNTRVERVEGNTRMASRMRPRDSTRLIVKSSNLLGWGQWWDRTDGGGGMCRQKMARAISRFFLEGQELGVQQGPFLQSLGR